MELQFQKTQLPCLHTLLYNRETQEQTQEIRISDGMPDIGSILGTWGQVILRSKEWQTDTLTVSGGTMVWVQYIPEEGGPPQSVEAWIPFQMHWNIPPTQHDGVMLVQCMLKSADARSTSARKLMLRSNISCLIHGMQRCQKELYRPGELPPDVQLHEVSYPILLPSEAGEKAFTLEESFPLPTPLPNRIIASSLQPQVTERRIMGDKLIFRGTGHLHVLLETEGGTQETMDFELPFSQYSELDQSYEEDAAAILWPAVTAQETELTEDRLRVHTGLTVQYVIRHRPLIRVVDDAYSPKRPLEFQMGEVNLPGILESKIQPFCGQLTAGVDALRAVDVQMLPQPISWEGDRLHVPVTFQTLCRDISGDYHTHTEKWEETFSIPAGENVRLEASLWPSGKPQGSMISGNLQIQAELELHTDAVLDAAIPMITGLSLGEPQPADPARPSLILRRAGERSLWQLAKDSASTVEDIMRVNHLQSEPEQDQMLLIPVKG